jgi:hypothetical protein
MRAGRELERLYEFEKPANYAVCVNVRGMQLFQRERGCNKIKKGFTEM